MNNIVPPRPTLSVLIPTYEPNGFLVDALRSVLEQDLGAERMQIAVVDDASRASRPPALLERLGAPGRIEVFEHQENLGLAGNWNRALALARGEFIHLLHQDDLVRPGFYDALLRGLRSSPGIGMAFCRHAFIDANGAADRISHRERWGAGPLRGWLARIAESQRVQCPAVIVRRAAYEALGGFNAGLRYALDWEMWVRLAARFEVWYEPRVLACYRRHAQAESARLGAAGLINDDVMSAIERFAEHLPAERRTLLTHRAYRKLARTQLRRAAKLIETGAAPRAAAHAQCAQEALQRLPKTLATRWAHRRLRDLEKRIASAARIDRA